MTVSSISSVDSYLNFKVQAQKMPKPAKTNKNRAATTLASCVLPGLGQAINGGQWGKAAAFMIPAILVRPCAVRGNIIAGLANLALMTASAIDAYKNA